MLLNANSSAKMPPEASEMLKIGIVGLRNVGKSTLFNTLAKMLIAAGSIPLCTIDPSETHIPDEPFKWFGQLFTPESEVPEFLQIQDIDGLVQGAHKSEGLGNSFWSHIRATNGLFLILRAFEDPDIIHVDGAVDPGRDLEIISEIFRLNDIEFTEKKTEDIEKIMANDPNDEKLKEVLDCCHRVKASLEEGNDVRLVDWKAADLKIINTLQLVTAKPIVYLVNMDERDYQRKDDKFLPKIQAWAQEHGGERTIPFSCALEKNLADITEEEASKYCEENKVQSALPKIIKTGFSSINLGCFFNEGPNKVKCLQVRRQTTYPQAVDATSMPRCRDELVCQDVISTLPDGLLEELLSRLPLKTVVSTAILAKRWKSLWKNVSVLNISFEDDQGPSVSAIHQTLVLCQFSKMRKLTILMTKKYANSFSYDVDTLISFALEKNVNELQLSLVGEDPCVFKLTLPSVFFHSSSWTTLKLKNCLFKGTMPICWKSLKVLVLNRMSVTNSWIRRILSGCPLLETMELHFCFDFSYIESKILHRLIINGSGSSLLISAPSLHYLVLSGWMGSVGPSLYSSPSSLVEAHISFELVNNDPYTERPFKKFTKLLWTLLDQMRHAELLTIGKSCLQILSLAEKEASVHLFSRLTHLTLHTELSRCDRSGITRLFSMTPMLAVVKIKHLPASEFNNHIKKEFLKFEDEHKGNLEASIEESMKNLKTMKLVDFQGSEDESEFVAFMLSHVKRLQGMIVQPEGSTNPFTVIY